MKKFISIALAAVMALGLTACGEKAPAASSSAADDTKVVVFWYDESDVYLGSVRDAMNKEFEALGITPDNQFAANNQTTQLDQIKTAIAGGADVLVVNQVTSGASVPMKATVEFSSNTVTSEPSVPIARLKKTTGMSPAASIIS